MSPFCLGVSVCLSACLQVCLWELFTRRLPWEGMAPLQVSTVSRSLHGPAVLPDDTRRISAGNGHSLRWLGCAIVLCLCLCCWRMQVIQSVASGMRLPVPDDAPPVVRELMASCFATDPAARPTMQQITDALAAVAPSQLPVTALASPPNSISGSSPKHGGISGSSSRSSGSGGSSGGSERRKAARRRERNGSTKEQSLEDMSAPLLLKEPV